MNKKILLLTGLTMIAGITVSQTVFLDEDFEGGSFPGTWSQTTNSTDGGFNYGTAGALSSTSFQISNTNSTNMLATNDDDCDCDKSEDWLILPTLDLTTAGYTYMSFDAFYYNGTYGSATEIVKIKSSLDGGTTWSDLMTLDETSGWESVLVDLNSLTGNSSVTLAIHYDDAGGWLYGLAIDNVKVFEPAIQFDAGITQISNWRYANAGNLGLTAEITNYGGVPITAIDVVWTDGTNSYTESLTGLNITYLQTHTFTHADPLAVTSGSLDNIKMYTILPSDSDASNDTSDVQISGLTFATDKHVVGEEGTGTWCGWCPRGHVYMAQMEASPKWIGIAVHNGDPMVVSSYDAGVGSWISGYPGGIVDRNVLADPSLFPSVYAARTSIVTPADITVTNINLNQSTGELSFDVNATFAVNADVNMRLNAVIVEDNVTGTSGYSQVNYYSFQSQNIALNGAGHNWQTEPNPVPAANMVYDDVARAILGGFNGSTSSIPASVTAGSTYTKSYSYMIPVGQKSTNMRIIGMLHNADNNYEIMNAGMQDAPVGIDENYSVSFDVNIYPNPTSDNANIVLTLKETDNVSIDIMDITGKIVKSNQYGQLSGSQNFIVDGSRLEAGMYLIRITVGNETLTKYLNVVK